MDPESTKHGPRLDDAIEHETASLTAGAPVESRSRDERRQQDIDLRDTRNFQAEDRSALAQVLAPARFPAGRDALVDVARQEHAGDDLIARLTALPDGDFATVQEVWENLPF